MTALDVMANNLANVNTPGFKEEKTFFTVLSQTGNSAANNELNRVTNSQSVAWQTGTNQVAGSLQLTQRELDVALTGNGLLTVRTDQGERYTRDGSLTLSPSAVLTTADGLTVLGENGPMTLGPGKVIINESGDVFLNGTRVDRLKLTAFEDPRTLQHEGGSLLSASKDARTKAADAKVRQGYLEQSNVNPVTAVVGLVNVMRQFESMQKSLNLIMNDLDSKSIDKLGR
jgi:flagellar basal body rod protein FlgG